MYYYTNYLSPYYATYCIIYNTYAIGEHNVIMQTAVGQPTDNSNIFLFDNLIIVL